MRLLVIVCSLGITVNALDNGFRVPPMVSRPCIPCYKRVTKRTLRGGDYLPNTRDGARGTVSRAPSMK